jgi:hypothetical protein
MGIAGLFSRINWAGRKKLTPADKVPTEQKMDAPPAPLLDLTFIGVTAPVRKDAVYEVLGNGAGQSTAFRLPPVSEGRTADAEQLFDMFYAQYRLALVLPDSVRQENWGGTDSLHSLAEHEFIDLQEQKIEATGTVSEFVLGNQSIEEAFGPLNSELSMPPLPDDTPDILRLFAPPEFLAGSPVTARPPELARREHHVMSIDSPVISRNTQTITHHDGHPDNE